MSLIFRGLYIKLKLYNLFAPIANIKYKYGRSGSIWNTAHESKIEDTLLQAPYLFFFILVTLLDRAQLEVFFKLFHIFLI